MTHQAATPFHVVRVTAKINAPHPSVRVAGHIALNGIDQPMTFPQRKVKSCVHARSSQQVVQQVEGHASFIMDTKRTSTYHHMRLMGSHGAVNGGWELGDRCWGIGVGGCGNRLFSSKENISPTFLYHFHHVPHLHVAINKEHTIFRTIAASHKTQGIVRRIGL